MTPMRMLCAVAVAAAAAASTVEAQTVAGVPSGPTTPPVAATTATPPTPIVGTAPIAPLTVAFFEGSYVLTKAGTSPTAAAVARCPVTLGISNTVTVANATNDGRGVGVVATDSLSVNGAASCVSPCLSSDIADGLCEVGDVNKEAQVLLFASREGFNATSANNATTGVANPMEASLTAADFAYYTGRNTGELRCGGGVTLLADARSYWVYSPTAAVPLSFDLPSSTPTTVRSVGAGIRRLFFLLDDRFNGTWCGYAGASAVERDTSGRLGLPAGVTLPAPPLPVVVITEPPSGDGADGADGQPGCDGQDGQDGADGVGGNGEIGRAHV